MFSENWSDDELDYWAQKIVRGYFQTPRNSDSFEINIADDKNEPAVYNLVINIKELREMYLQGKAGYLIKSLFKMREEFCLPGDTI